VQTLLDAITRESSELGNLRLMHVCGTHERAIEETGLRSLLPKNIRLVAGPGCPVCVCPASDIIAARELALKEGFIIAAFGDMLTVPAPGGSLLDARSRGGDIRLVYSVMDALRLARDMPDREVVFFSVGFETTAATTASILRSIHSGGDEEVPANFSILPSNRLIPPALEYLFSPQSERDEAAPRAALVDGLILPGHVSVIIGQDPYRPLAEKLGLACAISGFEALDILTAIYDIISQIKTHSFSISNRYTRAVLPQGNEHARRFMAEVFDIVDAPWRGVGLIPRSGLVPSSAYRGLNVFERFGLEQKKTHEEEPSGCLCASVILGSAESEDCPLFAGACRPEDPIGPCMVSDEGTCRIRFEYGGHE
jgi:hydrogenase expression/formation protein HypD